MAAADAVTLAFYADDADRDRLVALAPTGDVRLIRTPAFRPDLMAAALTAFEAGGGAELFAFPGGPLGAELAARLAARAGGGVLHRRPERRRRTRPACSAAAPSTPTTSPAGFELRRRALVRHARRGLVRRPRRAARRPRRARRRSSWRPTARPRRRPMTDVEVLERAGHRRPRGGEVPRRRRPRRRQPRRRGAPRRRRRAHGRDLRRHAPGRHERLGGAGPPDRRLRHAHGPRRLRRRGGLRRAGVPLGRRARRLHRRGRHRRARGRSSARPTPPSWTTPWPSSRRSPTSSPASAPEPRTQHRRGRAGLAHGQSARFLGLLTEDCSLLRLTERTSD